jgi:Membrane-associated lipoprotein involved in thiamine biosynthesis
MGTTWSLHAVLPPAGAGQGVQAVLDRVVGEMSQWDEASDLSRFNRAAPGVWRDVPAELAHVLQAALAIGRSSGGAFDPALGRVTQQWGFGSAGPVERAPDKVQPSGRIEFDLQTRKARRSEDALLDLSGIAKGYGVDAVAEWLLAQRTRHFLIEVGGELRGEGIRPDGQPWWVDVELPPDWTGAGWRIALHGLAVATSGDYRRGFEVEGKRYSHSFDPRTGRPIINGVRSVTVIHRSCMMADGWATAFTVLGPEAAMKLANEEQLAACVMAGGREYISRAWAAMLD